MGTGSVAVLARVQLRSAGAAKAAGERRGGAGGRDERNAAQQAPRPHYGQSGPASDVALTPQTLSYTFKSSD